MRTIALLLLCCPPLAAGWSNFGGNAVRNCLSPFDGPSQPHLSWQGTLPGSYGQQVFIEGNRLVTYRYRHTPWLGRVVCHDLTTGDTLWTREFPGGSGRPMPIGFRDGRVYVVDLKTASEDSLYALDAIDGSLLWVCPVPLHTYLNESATWCSDGDLIVSGSGFRTMRVDSETGDTVWILYRVWPVSGAADVTVHGSTGYCWSGALVGGSMKMYAIDVETGTRRDSALIPDSHPGGPAPQAGFWVGPDSIVYAHRVGDNVTAIRDHGDSLEVLWTHVISDEYPYYSPWSQFGSGPDSSVYVPSFGRVSGSTTRPVRPSTPRHCSRTRMPCSRPTCRSEVTARSTSPTAASPAAGSTRSPRTSTPSGRLACPGSTCPARQSARTASWPSPAVVTP